MNTFLLILGAATFVSVIMLCQLKAFKKKHPNAKLLIRVYQMIT
jgi:hypothetical protein